MECIWVIGQIRMIAVICELVIVWGNEELIILEYLKGLNHKSIKENGFERVEEVKTSLFYQLKTLIPPAIDYCFREG